ncbi:MAG: pantetheine-phosphate adenylyltransferase [Promethearchaeota archaeon]
MEYPYTHVGLGGSFDHLHKGHKFLLKTAFKLGKFVHIALTMEKLLKKKQYLQYFEPYSVRFEHLCAYIEQELNIEPERYSIIPLEDPYGPAITSSDLEVHISSLETYSVALKINEIRLEKGLNPLILVIIPILYNYLGEKISSTQIRKKIAKSIKK